MSANVGDEIEYRVWNGSGWDTHFAFVRVAPEGHPAHGVVSLYYGASGATVNNVLNIENWTVDTLDGNDHWRNVGEPFQYNMQPYVLETSEPQIGQIISFRRFNSEITEFEIFNAIVNAIQGPPGQEHPTINLIYFDIDGRHNVNGVVPPEDLIKFSGPSGYESTDHWFNHPMHNGE
jgi:hypothetical protein